jgi:hypothetical protein
VVLPPLARSDLQRGDAGNAEGADGIAEAHAQHGRGEAVAEGRERTRDFVDDLARALENPFTLGGKLHDARPPLEQVDVSLAYVMEAEGSRRHGFTR